MAVESLSTSFYGEVPEAAFFIFSPYQDLSNIQRGSDLTEACVWVAP
jgi:hypothetical protein